VINVVPAIGWLKTYPATWLRFDAIAGLTTAAVVIPKAMAFAAIAGLPLEAGLYTAVVPLVVYAVLGTSRPLSVTTTSTIAILVAATLAGVAPGGDSATLMTASAALALMVGGVLVLAAVLRLGFLANFISDPVLTGFKAGIGIVIVVDQLPKLLGVHVQKGGFFENLVSIAQHVPQSSVPTVVLGLVMLGLIVGLERFAPRVPAPLVAVAIGIAASGLLGLERSGVALVGQVRPGLPSFALPDVSLARQLWPSAVGIALMSFVETVAAGRSFLRAGEPLPAPNQELLALGLANVAGSPFSIMPAGGGTSQTAVNRAAGARTQIAGLVTAAAVVATLLLLAPIIGLMPQAALAAVVVATTVGLISPMEFGAIRRIRHMEFWWALVGAAGVVLLGTLNGILVAVAVSLLVLFYHANHPPVYLLGRKPGTDVFRPLSAEHPEDETVPGLLLLRTEGRLQFANAHRVGEKVWQLVHEARPRVLAVDLSAVPDIEYTALKAMAEFEGQLQEAGTVLWLVALNPEALRVVQLAPLGKTLGRGRMFVNLEQAVDAYRAAFTPGFPDGPRVRRGTANCS